MLGGKAGIFHCHMGAGERKMEMFFRLLAETEIPPTQIIPTHVNRNHELLADAVKFTQQGGYIDITAGMDPESSEDEISVAEAVQTCIKNRTSLKQITVSSDSNGSMPRFDKEGKLVGLTIATQKSLLINFRYLIKNKILSLEDTLRLFSSNSADFYKFDHKGEIKKGKDADLLFFDKDLNLTDVFTMGQRKMAEGKLLVKGTFDS
jgi:beta-aspartyl-dipeptidase (metallo-type)